MPRKAPDLSVDTMERPEEQEPAPPLPRVQMLDRSRRDIGVISGNPFQVGTDEDGNSIIAHFTQPDRYGVIRYFDQAGYRLKRDGEPPDGYQPKAPPKPRAQRPLAIDPAAREAIDRFEDEHRRPGDPVVVGEVNLTEWMLRKVEYPFGMLRKAIRERYAKECGSIADCFDFLSGQGIVTPEQLREAGVPLSNDQ